MEAAASPEAPATPVRPGRRQLLLGVGHLAGLWAITFAQPLLDLLGQNPDFFVARGNSVGDILILAFVVIIIGFLSAVVDNVPLVAAAQGMYTLEQFPTDHYFWEFLAYCAGTGGSALISGSAAGVAAMGMERIDFFWYLRRITLWAVIGYLAGAAAFVVQYAVFY